MIEPTKEDIGRRVIYRSPSGYHSCEVGTITSFNDHYVFVRYGHSTTSAATLRSDLEWVWPQTQPQSLP